MNMKLFKRINKKKTRKMMTMMINNSSNSTTNKCKCNNNKLIISKTLKTRMKKINSSMKKVKMVKTPTNGQSAIIMFL